MNSQDVPMTPSEVLELVEDICCYPYISIANQLLSTTLVTVAEMHFSKLKLLKNYMRSFVS